MFLRPANPSDKSSLLALSTGVEGGMTSLPKDAQAWEKKLELVFESVHSSPNTNKEALYFLVLEDENTGRIAGTTAIHAGVGLKKPFYTYKLAKHVTTSEELNIRVESTTLNLVNDFTGGTEFGSLYVHPDYRGMRIGKFLSQSRFLMMHDFPERFSDHVFAEIRGWLDENKTSPFWEHLGKKFFKLTYDEADNLSAKKGSQFISDLMPHHPIYTEILPKVAQDVIGKPHDHSATAMKYLIKQGFRYIDSVDIFDAGPVIEGNRSNFPILNQCKTVTVAGFEDFKQDTEKYALSNQRIENYRMTFSAIRQPTEDHVILPTACQKQLDIQAGDSINLMPLT